MILFFETYSILQTLVLLGKVRQAKAIYFHSGSIPYSYRFRNFSRGERYKRIVLKIIRTLNKDVNIHIIPQEKTNEYSWKANRNSLSVIDKISTIIEKSAPFNIALSVIRDKSIIKYYQHYLAQGYIANRISFLEMGRDLQTNVDEVICVPAENDVLEIIRANTDATLIIYVPEEVYWINKVFVLWERLNNLLVFLLLPMLFVLREVIHKGFRFDRVKKKRHDIMQRVATGFRSGEYKSGAHFITDDFLLNESAGLNDIIYIFDRKEYKGDFLMQNKQILEGKSIPYFEISECKANFSMFVICIMMQLRILRMVVKNPFIFTSASLLIFISSRALHDFLRKLLELEYIEPKVEFSRTDGNADHIMQTIVLNKIGSETVGLQHNSTAGPYVWPQLCYVHFDKYCIYSTAHLRLHSPHWQAINIAQTGSPMADKLISLARNEERVNELKDKVSSLYGKRKHIILITFPNPMPYSLPEKWAAMYDALLEFPKCDIDATVFLRFRNVEHLNDERLRRFRGLIEEDSRIVIDHENFATYEIMVLSNLCITSSHSSGIVEALALKKKAFALDYMGTAKYCFSRYGKDIVLQTKEDILRTFEGLESGFASFDCDWDLMREEYNYHYDGKCLGRVQEAVHLTLNEVSKK